MSLLKPYMLPKPVEDNKVLHENIGEMTDNELTLAHDSYKRLAAYMSYQAALVFKELEETKIKVVRLYIDLKYNNPPEGKTKTESKEKIEISDDYVEVEDNEINLRTKYEIMKSLIDGYKDKAEGISREITRRNKS